MARKKSFDTRNALEILRDAFSDSPSVPRVAELGKKTHTRVVMARSEGGPPSPSQPNDIREASEVELQNRLNKIEEQKSSLPPEDRQMLEALNKKIKERFGEAHVEVQPYQWSPEEIPDASPTVKTPEVPPPPPQTPEASSPPGRPCCPPRCAVR